MSFNLRDIREVSDEPLTKFVSHLAYRIQKLAMEQQTQELENKEDIYSNGQDVDTVLRFHSLTSTKIFDFSLPFYPPLEPDLDKNTIWIQGHNMIHHLVMHYLKTLVMITSLHIVISLLMVYMDKWWQWLSISRPTTRQKPISIRI